MFYTGQRVVALGTNGRRTVRKGRIYTVEAKVTSNRGNPGLVLFGIAMGPGKIGFPAFQFRPLCEPKTSIEIFRKALIGDLIEEDA